MTLLLAFICGLLLDDAITRLIHRVASKLPKNVLQYGKKVGESTGILEPKGKIISLKELDALEAFKKGGRLEEILDYGNSEGSGVQEE